VAGFDGQEISEFSVPRLTTLRQPLDDISEETIRLIFDLIEEKRGNKHLIFPGELIVAESTRKL
jgi:LacI family transcriptional regulator